MMIDLKLHFDEISEVTMRDHVKGRRHQQALVAVERRKALARNSLYCHGFPPSTSQAALQSYFQVFGVVTRIMVETHRVRRWREDSFFLHFIL